MGFASIGILHLSLQYIGIPVKATTLTGAPYNPSADTVQMAFMPTPTQVPGPSDWQAALFSAVTGNLVYPYAAYCLVGPGGTINPGIGNYIIWLKISDNPEVPVIIAGQLAIS